MHPPQPQGLDSLQEDPPRCRRLLFRLAAPLICHFLFRLIASTMIADLGSLSTSARG